MRTSAPTNSPALTPAAAPAAGRLLQRKCACGTHTDGGGECDSCGNTRLQRKASNHPDPPEVPEAVHDVLRSPGRPLDAATRSFMEPRFAHDFSHVPAHAAAPPAGNLTVVRPDDWSEHEADRVARRVTHAAPSGRDGGPRHDFGGVRVHTDAKAAASALALNARAYTVGGHIVFAEGQYDPVSSAGRELIAHELAHVAQTGAAPSSQLRNSLHRKTFEADEANCTATLGYSVRLIFEDLKVYDIYEYLKFDERALDAWAPLGIDFLHRKAGFRNQFKKLTEDTFNGSTFRIKSEGVTVPFRAGLKDGKACPCPDKGFKPMLQINVLNEGVVPAKADWELKVKANFLHRSGPDIFRSRTWPKSGTGKLDEGDLALTQKGQEPGSKQVPAVHEVGHLLGLHHPGKGIGGNIANFAEEYEHKGKDIKGREVYGPTDLMGEGMGLRPFYFDNWRDELKKKYGPGCNWQVVDKPGTGLMLPFKTYDAPRGASKK
jgi:hypothetical protein